MHPASIQRPLIFSFVFQSIGFVSHSQREKSDPALVFFCFCFVFGLLRDKSSKTEPKSDNKLILKCTFCQVSDIKLYRFKLLFCLVFSLKCTFGVKVDFSPAVCVCNLVHLTFYQGNRCFTQSSLVLVF